jgi:hypothetical protein
MSTTKIQYRVRPEFEGFASEDFDELEDAISRATIRNAPRRKDYGKDLFWKGDNCKLQKVTTVVEDITL